MDTRFHLTQNFRSVKRGTGRLKRTTRMRLRRHGASYESRTIYTVATVNAMPLARIDPHLIIRCLVQLTRKKANLLLARDPTGK
jgi:hypothetical protein